MGQVTCLFVAQSYLHRLKCAYVNSSEKVRQLLFFMYKVKSLNAEAAGGKPLVV
jgi:hypothetical protein